MSTSTSWTVGCLRLSRRRCVNFYAHILSMRKTQLFLLLFIGMGYAFGQSLVPVKQELIGTWYGEHAEMQTEEKVPAEMQLFFESYIQNINISFYPDGKYHIEEARIENGTWLLDSVENKIHFTPDSTQKKTDLFSSQPKVPYSATFRIDQNCLFLQLIQMNESMDIRLLRQGTYRQATFPEEFIPPKRKRIRKKDLASAWVIKEIIFHETGKRIGKEQFPLTVIKFLPDGSFRKAVVGLDNYWGTWNLEDRGRMLVMRRRYELRSYFYVEELSEQRLVLVNAETGDKQVLDFLEEK